MGYLIAIYGAQTDNESMSVPNCHLCKEERRDPTPQEQAEGDYCPTCHRPTCGRHMAVVRFRWKETRQVDSAMICKDCKTRYEHRYWDTARRDWIS